jgi:hypothetical protein
MNNQAGIHSKRNNPVKTPPVAKLIQERYASMTTIEPLQIISNVFILVIYNEITGSKMGIIP